MAQTAQERGHHRPRSRPGSLPPQGDHHPAPAEQVRTVPAQRPGAGAPRRQARRPRISRHRPASMGQAHGSKAAQVPHGLPALPRPDPCRTATSRNPGHGINHQRAGCREIWHVRFGGGIRKRTRELRAPRRTAYPTPVRRLVADTARCPDRDRLSLPENVPRACRQSPGRLHGPLCLPGAGAGQQRDEHLRVGASPACHRVPPRSGLVTGDRDYG